MGGKIEKFYRPAETASKQDGRKVLKELLAFAHICDTGVMRRTRLRGWVDVTKRYLIAAAGHDLGRILLKLFGLGESRSELRLCRAGLERKWCARHEGAFAVRRKQRSCMNDSWHRRKSQPFAARQVITLAASHPAFSRVGRSACR